MAKRSSGLLLASLIGGMLALPLGAQAQGIAGPYLAAQQAEARGDVAAAARLYSRTLARDAGNLHVMERAMLNQIAAGNVSEGIALARRLQDVQPGHHVGALALAIDAVRDADHERAQDYLDENSPFVGLVIAAWASWGAGDLQAARTRLTEMEASDANGQAGKLVSAYHLGLIEAAAGNDAEAAAAIERATAISPNGSLRMTHQLAAALARQGQTDAAVTVIRDRLAGTYGDAALERLADEIAAGNIPAVDIDSASKGVAEVMHGVAALLARGQNGLIALSYARLATFLDPSLSEAQLLVAQILDRDDQYDLAIAAYDAISPDAPEALRAQIGRAEAMQAAGQADEAVSGLRATIDQFPEAIEARTALGNMLRREERFAEAGVAYDGAVSLLPSVEPQHWVLFYQRGISMERSDQWEKAEADFRRALELEPDQADVLNYLGYSWVEKGLNLSEAEKMIEKAVEQRPEDGYIVDSLGWVLYRFGEFERATEQLERAVELRPVDPVINDHFGDALWMVGRRTEARFQWRRALSFEPEEKDAKRIRRKLEDGLDAVLAEEKELGLPGIIGRQTENDSGNGQKNNDGG